MISASSYTPEEPISAIATPLAPGALGNSTPIQGESCNQGQGYRFRP